MKTLRWLICAMVALLGAERTALAVGTYEVSPVFGFDTRDSNSAHYTISAPFVFDTRDSNSTHYGQSGAFAFNTRAIDGLSGNRASGGFGFDTRSATATGLTVIAPASFSGGSSILLGAMATFSTGFTEDVSDRATWSVTGGPAGTRMVGRTLQTGYSAVPVTAFVQASYLRYDRRIISAPHAIAIGPALSVALSVTPPVGVGSGAAISWTLHATATATGGVAPFTAQWRWRGNMIPGQTSLSLVAPVGGPLGSGQLDVSITDAQGKLGNAFTLLALNKPSAPTQPLQTITTRDKEPGTLYHGDGVTGVNLLSARTDAGLLVIVHGLTDRVELPDPANPCGAWMMRMAQSIEMKLTGTAHGPPNVLLYDWSESANPSKYRGTDAKNQAAKDFYAELGDRRSWLAGPGFAPIVYDNLTKAEQTTVDIRYIREIAERHGEALYDWIETQISALKISADAPIHLVGHSAGGFVVATCAGRLLQKHAMPNLLVTTLDTPMFHAKHITGVKDHGARIERYNSMVGGITPALTFIKDRRTYLRSIFDNPQPRSISVLSYTTPIVIPDPGYRIGEATSTDTCPATDTFAMHSEAHEWYIASVQSAEQWHDGFYFSPFLGNTWTDGGAVIAAQAAPSPALAVAAAPPLPDQSLGGFQTFGQVAESAGEFTLTELDDAGIFQTLTVPIGATDLKFRVRFDQLGDGDFLEVGFGDHAPLAVIDGLATTSGQWLDYEVSTRAIAGENGTLIFRLVSRGASNAVARLDSLAFAMSDDPDGDELSNSEEAMLGTDPLVFDTDGDGLSDGFEVHTAHTNPTRYDTDGDGVDDYLELATGTNPLGSASVFSVKYMATNGDGSIALWWTGRGGSTYRVLRAVTPDFASFEVVAAAVPGVYPLTTFTDAKIDARVTPAEFYRVEVADAPAYAANMGADSDGDGIPDGWELNNHLNPDAAADGLEDWDGDGFSNLLEFALGLDPHLDSALGGPEITTEGGWLTLTATRNPAAVGLLFRVAVSDDLVTWFADAAHVTTLPSTPRLFKARDNVPIDAAARRFIRLEVSKP